MSKLQLYEPHSPLEIMGRAIATNWALGQQMVFSMESISI